MNYISASS